MLDHQLNLLDITQGKRFEPGEAVRVRRHFKGGPAHGEPFGPWFAGRVVSPTGDDGMTTVEYRDEKRRKCTGAMLPQFVERL